MSRGYEHNEIKLDSLFSDEKQNKVELAEHLRESQRIV